MRPNDKTWWEMAFPAVTSLRNYHLAWLRLDLLAGVHPGGVSAPCSIRRCIARKFATGSGSLCLSLRRTYLLDLLRFALHRRLGYFCNLARYRLLAWRDYRR